MSINNMTSDYFDDQSKKSYYPRAKQQISCQQLLRQTVCHDSIDNEATTAFQFRSQCLNQKDQVKQLLELISKYEKQIKQKQIYYSKVTYEINNQIHKKVQQNRLLLSEIYQLKGESKKIKSQTQNLKGNNEPRLKKAWSSRDILQGIKKQCNLDSINSFKSSTNILRSTLPYKQSSN